MSRKQNRKDQDTTDVLVAVKDDYRDANCVAKSLAYAATTASNIRVAHYLCAERLPSGSLNASKSGTGKELSMGRFEGRRGHRELRWN